MFLIRLRRFSPSLFARATSSGFSRHFFWASCHILKRGWFKKYSTPDGQQYVVQGQEINPGIISEGVADNEPRTGELTTTNLDEAIKFLGFEPDLPTWIPDGWMLTSYEVGVITDETIIKATYAKADDMIVYIQKRYADLDNAYASFEQNAEGHVTIIGNTEVYCSENINRARYNWKKDNDVFSLAGKLRLCLREIRDIMTLSQQRGCRHGEITASA